MTTITSENIRENMARLLATPKPTNVNQAKKVACFDIETDPFLHGRVPTPFCCGLLIEGEEPITWWGADCLWQFYAYVNELTTPLYIYAHNGGKFDFIYLLREGILDTGKRMMIINGRISKCFVSNHELRDSYNILPVALHNFEVNEGKKFEFDYDKMEEENREKHREEITKYLIQDLHVGLGAVMSFLSRYGNKLTIGSAAIGELRKHHPFDKMVESYDAGLRKYFFGGRVQCFEGGIVRGDLKVYDVNSMYPAVMANEWHFCGTEGTVLHTENIGDYLDLETGLLIDEPAHPYFLEFQGTNNNALATRTKDGLDFTIKEGTFYATSHEIKTALKYGLITIDKPLELVTCFEPICFSEYVAIYSAEKIAAKKSGDVNGTLIAKLMLNSSYGKTAQNSRNYKDYALIDEGSLDYYAENDWLIDSDFDDYYIMSKPADTETFFDVGIGASITGAARAVMLEAIATATRPIYCDTDSLICEGLNGVELDPTKLGAWDLEAESDEVAIAGKKLYSMISKDGKEKLACKGVRLSAAEIRRVAKGESVTYVQDAPSFKLKGGDEFVQRIIGAEKHSKLYDKFGQKKEFVSQAEI